MLLIYVIASFLIAAALTYIASYLHFHNPLNLVWLICIPAIMSAIEFMRQGNVQLVLAASVFSTTAGLIFAAWFFALS